MSTTTSCGTSYSPHPGLCSKTALNRLAILGLTFQYTTSRISRDEYDKYHSIYYDEVARLNPPPPPSAATDYDFKPQSPDDTSVYASDELRFTMFRHWNLYDAMYHSNYVASKLGIWKERGKKRLTGLLAKMGWVSSSVDRLCVCSRRLDFVLDSQYLKHNSLTRTWQKTSNSPCGKS